MNIFKKLYYYIYSKYTFYQLKKQNKRLRKIINNLKQGNKGSLRKAVKYMEELLK